MPLISVSRSSLMSCADVLLQTIHHPRAVVVSADTKWVFALELQQGANLLEDLGNLAFGHFFTCNVDVTSRTPSVSSAINMALPI